MSFNLIPFGYHKDTGKYLDVFEVPKGKASGCVCPSCDTPLIARHGKVNDWHFAHASRKVYEKTTQKCEYSFFLSVRMMVRQFVGTTLSIHLPEYRTQLEAPLKSYNKKIIIPFSVTQQQKVAITNIEVEKKIADVIFDFIGNVGKFKFMVFLSHTGRELPIDFQNKTRVDVGIITISLAGIAKLFFNQKGKKSAYKAILLDFIQNDLISKEWIKHPRYETAKNEAEQKLVEFKGQFIVNGVIQEGEIFSFLTKNDELKEVANKEKVKNKIREKYSSFSCEICKTTWRKNQSSSSGKLTCPVCEPS